MDGTQGFQHIIFSLCRHNILGKALFDSEYILLIYENIQKSNVYAKKILDAQFYWV
jgi:hypothetical protein